MRITFLTLGSRGDVQPYVALAKELIKNGHEAVVCTGQTFKKFIEENGLIGYIIGISLPFTLNISSPIFLLGRFSDFDLKSFICFI